MQNDNEKSYGVDRVKRVQGANRVKIKNITNSNNPINYQYCTLDFKFLILFIGVYK